MRQNESHGKPPKRLEAILSLIPEKAKCVADIGYDHGKIITRLVKQRQGVRVIGIEQQPGIADRYWKLFAPSDPSERERIDLRTGSGFEPLLQGEADTAVVAGLGENVIADMLEAERLEGFNRLILTPVNTRAVLIPKLETLGWQVIDGRIAYENSRYYRVIVVERGDYIIDDQVKRHFGEPLFKNKDPYLYSYLLQVKKHLKHSIEHLENQCPEMKNLCVDLDAAISAAENFCS